MTTARLDAAVARLREIAAERQRLHTEEAALLDAIAHDDDMTASIAAPAQEWVRRKHAACRLQCSVKTITRHARRLGAERMFGGIVYVDVKALWADLSGTRPHLSD